MWRIGFGAAFFICLALCDFYKNRSRATRWREYLYLLGGVAGGIIYGLVNDFVSSAISWEYFYYGKGFYSKYPDPAMAVGMDFYREVALVAVSATWWAGLIIAAAHLFCNSVWAKSGKIPTLNLCELFRLWFYIIVIAALFSAICALAAFWGCFDFLEQFREILQADLFRPRRFIVAWGLHLGSYAGAFAAMVLSCVLIIKRRLKLKTT